MARYWLVFVCLVGLATAIAQPAVEDRLPVKRVVLYKNGIGYFEHLGRVRGSEEIAIPFTSGQLNDVLKTLTVLDLDGGRIAGVAYGSSAPVDRQLGDLRLPIGEKASLSEFLGALRGTRLEVRSGTNTITGRLLSVERKTRMNGGATLEVDYISLIADGGEIKTTEVSPSFSVKLLERGLPGKVDRYLDLLSAGREADVRRMVVSTQGSGDRSLFLSYISEVPVWKATYRIVLDSKAGGKPLLQGWAIVDNTTGLDWENAALSLVAGAPQSFIQNLSQPYYSRRPVVPLPESVNVRPQTYESTLIPGGTRIAGVVTDPTGSAVSGTIVKAYNANGSLADQTTASSSGAYEFQSLPEGTYLLSFESPGFQRAVINGVNASASRLNKQDVQLNIGSVSETVSVTASAPTIQTESSSMARIRPGIGSGRSLGSGGNKNFMPPPAPPAAPSYTIDGVSDARGRAQSAAFAQELGDLFEYKLKEPVTIRKGQSALVPIIQSPITVEKISIWNEQAGLPRPQRALWLTNSNELTLDGGSFSVLEQETFAGEGVFDPIRPSERRLISYATDLALNVSSKFGSEQQRVSRVRINHGVMIHESEVREKKTYTFRNEDTSPRTVIIEHPVRAGFDLRSDVKPAETTPSLMRFRLHVDPKQTAALLVEEGRPVQATYAINDVTTEQISLFLQRSSIDKTVEAALRKIVAQKSAISDLDAKINEHESETEKIFDDQQRLRENMKSLKGTVEEKALLQRYTKQLNDQETRLEVLKKESEQIEGERDAAKAVLNTMIQELSFDIKL
jgi:hypothetical protein